QLGDVACTHRPGIWWRGGGRMAQSVIGRVIVAACIASLMVLLDGGVASAFGYGDTGFDPDDREAIWVDSDIRTTTRTVWQSESGRRFLTVRFSAYEELGVYWFIYVRLDSRNGRRTDYSMALFNEDQSGKGCSVWRRHHKSHVIEGMFHQ